MPSPARRMFPMLSADDMAASIAFHRDVLGGTEAFRFPEDDPVFVTPISRGANASPTSPVRTATS